VTDPSAAAPLCVCLTGPTACGKTDVALALAEQFPIEIVSMDSALVYRGLDIGTAKPPADVRERVPHHLIDIVDPSDPYSAGRFVEDAARVVEDIVARHRIPLLVGGTMLYLRAFRDGLAPLPSADPALRARLDREAESLGWPALHARLAEFDPTTASRLASSDRQRIQRALEVYELTGEAISTLQQGGSGAEMRPTVAVLALVDDDRDAHACRIERRFDSMVEAGFVAEVERLRDRGDLSPDLPALRAVGYRQIWQYLDGAVDWEQTRASALAATRQLAKRQMTWLRSEANFATVAWSDSRRVELVGQWLSESIAG
jgi:tRNA dimethylallyltransferase